MATIGRIEEFVPGKGTWLQYYERVDFFFAANNIELDEKKKAVFFSICGPVLYSVVRSLCTPEPPSAIAFGEIIKKLNAHFSPKPSEILSRFKFHKRDQLPNESIADFIAEIRKLSEHCNFDSNLDSMLRDRLVCGLRDEQIQRRLLADSKLTLASAMDQALSGEAAARHAIEIRGGVVQESEVQQFKTADKSSYTKEFETTKSCFRCGRSHPKDKCEFIKAVCYYCRKVGHISKVCNLKAKDLRCKKSVPTSGKIHVVSENETTDPYLSFHNVLSLSSVKNHPPSDVIVNLNGISHVMEIDSGSLHSIMSTENFTKLWPKNPPRLLPVSDQLLRTWSLEKLVIKGYLDVRVTCEKIDAKLPLLIVEGNGKSLIGRSWFKALGIEIVKNSSVNSVGSKCLDALLKKYCDIFSETLGTIKGPPISIKLDENCSPKFLKSRNVPLALRDRVSKELDAMVEKGILEPVTYSDWATPIVPVVKRNGSIRICGDYRGTVNQAVKQFVYPLPTISHVLTTMSGGSLFSKLDMSEAYLQLPVDETTSHVLTMNTQKGLFKVKRLPFGVSVAVSIFQKRMEEVLSGIEGVLPYLDDIFIMGRNTEDHFLKLEQVLERLFKEGIHLRREKCKFAIPEIELLGFRVNKSGIQPTTEKVEAIHKAPTPNNKTELQAFLGLLNFYGCFLKNRSDTLEPLHQLLQKDAPWIWLDKHDKAYKAAKELLQRDDILVHFDQDLPVMLTCDASAYGLGAVLSHLFPDNNEAPIAYYSRTLAKAERNYSQTDKEALAIIAAVKKFHHYLAGRKFKIVTDHKPLLGLLNPGKPVPQMVSPRVLRWSLMLSAYDYQLEYRQGKQIMNADALSRLPVPTPDFEIPAPADVLLLESIPDFQIDAKLLASATKKDKTLSRVSLMVLNGWPSKISDENLLPYFKRRNELSVHNDCILWGSRVVIPEVWRKQVLSLLHNAHPGIVRMKGLARSYVWWPKMNASIELAVKSCTLCQINQKAPAKAAIHPWEWTEKPWSRIHIDFAGPFQGQVFFLVVDSHSKWLEVLPVPSFSSSTAISNLRALFATHGLPDTIVSDNATTFKSDEFRDFLKKNQIRQVFVAPYHPSSNGQIERMVDTTKRSLKRIIQGSWKARLARFLFSQHTLPCSTTGKSPAELLMNRRLASLLDRLHPDLNKVMRESKEQYAEERKKVRNFQPDDKVYIRSYTQGSPWTPAAIVQPTGPLSYKAQTSDGEVHHRHVDQIRERTVVDDMPNAESNLPLENLPDISKSDNSENFMSRVPAEELNSSHKQTPVPVIRRSERNITKPKYLDDYV